MSQSNVIRCSFLTVLGLLLCSAAPPSYAAECSTVFSSGVNDNLGASGFDLSGVPWANNPWPSSETELESGDYFFEGGTLPEDYELEVADDAQVRIFVSGNLTIGSDAEFDSDGELLLVVEGSLSIEKKVSIEGLVYAGGAISRGASQGEGNAPEIDGAIAAGGAITTDLIDVDYDSDIANTELCDFNFVSDVALPAFDNFESYQPGSINGENGGNNWGGPWAGESGQALIDTSDNPLEFIDSQGRRIRSATTLEITDNDNEIATRPLDGTFSGDSVYLSMLVRFTGDPTNNDFVGLWVEESGFGDSPQFGLKVNEGGGETDDFFVRLDRNADYSTDLEVGETYLLVAQYSKGDEEYFSNAKLWVNPECEASPPANVSAERSGFPPESQVTEFSEIGIRSANLSSADSFEIGQVAVGTQWTDVVRCSPGPLVEYRMEQPAFDGTPGEVEDTTGNGRNATAQGGTQTSIENPVVAGNPGTCRYADFDGTDDRLVDNNAASYLEGLEAVTVMAWVYNTASLDGNDRGIFFTGDSTNGRDNRFGLRYDTDGFFGGGDNVIKASVYTSDCDNLNQECWQVETESNVMKENAWQHVAMTWTTSGEIKVYVDGSEVGTSGTQGDGGTGQLTAIDKLEIGQGAKGQRWQGGIDEFRIFGVALTEAEIAAEMNRVFPCEGVGPDHIRLIHPGTGLTCRPSEITIQACADTNCNALYTDPVDVTMQPAGWLPSPGFTIINGEIQRQFQLSEKKTVTLGVAESTPPSNNGIVCFSQDGTGSCDLTFKDAGFVFYRMDGEEGLPDLLSGVEREFKMAALESDDQSDQCVAIFEDETKDVGFYTNYATPGPVDRDGEYTLINGEQVSRYDSALTSVPVTFDENGVATLSLRYDDAGLNGLFARYSEPDQPDGGTLMIEGDSTFRAAPYGLCLIPEKQCSLADMSCTDTHVAGTELTVTPKAYRWSNDLDSRTSCSEKLSTPSFALSDIIVLNEVQLPRGSEGGEDSDDLGTIDFGEGNQGLTFTEVGVFEAYTEAIPGGYLGNLGGYPEGLDVPASDKMMTPRFIPEKLEFITSSPDPLAFHSECGGFVYLEQPFRWDKENLPVLEFEALNDLGGRTENYTNPIILNQVLLPDDFQFSAPSGSDQVGTWVSGGGIVNQETAPLKSTFRSGSVSEGVPGVVEYQFSEEDEFKFSKDNVLEPFDANTDIVLQSTADGDGVPLTPADLKITAGGIELRYGRLAIENVYGPENDGTVLAMPFSAEYFKDGGFRTNLLDDGGLNGSSGCTVWSPAQVSIVDSTVDNPAPPHYQMNTSGDGDFVEGQAELELEATGTPATDTLEWDLPSMPWLRHYWGYEDAAAGVDDLQNPRATATFGVYRGNDRIIYWREVQN